jgi:cystathionine beta-lyase/cystathionine gamma-synthase
MTPIYQTSTYVQAAPGQHKGYEYARSQNPTRKALEEALAVIENAKYGLAFSSGVAATDACDKVVGTGDEVIASNDLYGGTYRLFTKGFRKIRDQIYICRYFQYCQRGIIHKFSY